MELEFGEVPLIEKYFQLEYQTAYRSNPVSGFLLLNIEF